MFTNQFKDLEFLAAVLHLELMDLVTRSPEAYWCLQSPDSANPGPLLLSKVLLSCQT